VMTMTPILHAISAYSILFEYVNLTLSATNYFPFLQTLLTLLAEMATSALKPNTAVSSQFH
jgi:hypothetical protein